MFLLCDNIEGKIYNVSKNCSNKLGITKEFIGKNQASLDFDLKVGSLSPTIDIVRIKEFASKNNYTDNCY